MAESQRRESMLFAFLPNQSTTESSKESTESSSSYGKKARSLQSRIMKRREHATIFTLGLEEKITYKA